MGTKSNSDGAGEYAQMSATFGGAGILEPINEGLLSRISDLLLCRWTCRNCCQKCYECSCCQSNEDEVEILGPFPAQTPPWL
ncbi:synaptotagmin-17 [Pantherophis guttatus]|uniref:Synaptotagmin-17 n=1 Tax=Pantherophis guttatus TaxID=94885 RepID=A0A6P9CFN0_PANGU|nr:synaptotagmin-17 [Pantherophis guttatus]